GTVLGPCLGWSSLTATALGAHTTAVSDITLTASNEQVTASTDSVNGTWVELRRYYDPGWRLDTHKPVSLGDGLFNLYHLDSAQSSAPSLSSRRSGWRFGCLAVSVLPRQRHRYGSGPQHSRRRGSPGGSRASAWRCWR